MNTLDYIKKYGDYTFEEMKFTEIDNIIFSLLSYVYYDDIVSENIKMRLEEVKNKFYLKYSQKEIKKNILAVRNGIKLLGEVSKTKRYKNIGMYNYKSITDSSQQFSVISFEISSMLTYVSFEGTDQQISGWEEDFMMAYKFPVEAQRNAIKYLNRKYTFKKGNIIVGGHSKGGNLALVASMYSNFIVRNKIVNIYNNDGPGLRLKQLESKQYHNIENRLIHIIPNYSIIGLLLRHTNDYKVVKSNRKGIFAHDAMSWQVNDKEFISSKLSNFSKVLDDGIIRWLDKYDDDKIKQFVDYIFEIFKKNNINSLLEITTDSKVILLLLKETKNVHSVVKDMIKDLVSILKQCNKEQLTFLIEKSKKEMQSLSEKAKNKK